MDGSFQVILVLPVENQRFTETQGNIRDIMKSENVLVEGLELQQASFVRAVIPWDASTRALHLNGPVWARIQQFRIYL